MESIALFLTLAILLRSRIAWFARGRDDHTGASPSLREAKAQRGDEAIQPGPGMTRMAMTPDCGFRLVRGSEEVCHAGKAAALSGIQENQDVFQFSAKRDIKTFMSRFSLHF